MRILLASSEVYPYSKTGGLGDMTGALAKFLGAAGNVVGVVTPLYRGVRDRFHKDIKRFDYFLEVPLGANPVQAAVWTANPHPGVTIYFIEHPAFYHRAGLYGEGDAAYPDNAQRFIFLSKCVAHLARYLSWQPEILHVHDWQTSLVPLLVLQQKMVDGWTQPPRTCLTIHNLAYQGIFPAADFRYTNLPLEFFTPNGVEFYGFMNCLKAGIIYADTVTTVSPRYAREITTEEFGCNLDGVLRQRGKSLVGILNGVDYEEWNPISDTYIKQNYSLRNLKAKAVNKLDLQQELGLPARPNIPLFANISRLVAQKGVDILLGALEEMLAADLQVILLGAGAPDFERACQQLAGRFPHKLAVRIAFDNRWAHRVEAGADFFLMPSSFEPCGLNQMYSLRYGTVPIVRITGGLDDSVIDAADDPQRANGIKFADYSIRALAKAIRKAMILYEEPEILSHYRRNGMKVDFSWTKVAKKYLEIYGG